MRTLLLKRYLLLLVSLMVITSVLNGQRRSSIPLKHGSHRIGVRTDEDMQRWRQHGLGQFIHWGVYAIPGGYWNGKYYVGAAEWIRSWSEMPKEDYDSLYKNFNPVNFDAKKWAKQAKYMGCKYLIFTTKHHDGFCLWPSLYTEYTVANTPFKRDIVGEIVDAYNAEGIDVILYFSIIDWNHKGYRSSIPTTELERNSYNQFLEFTRSQLMELLDRYPTIKGLWFDGTWDKAWINEAAFADKLDKELREKSSGIIIGSRFRADEYGKRGYDSNGDLIGDYEQSWERDIPNDISEVNGNDWDCIMTIPENQWGYHSEWRGYIKTSYDLIEMLAKSASMNGNFVLNFGPDGLGNIRPEECILSKEIGDWMSINGEAIYATTAINWKKQGWGYYTQKENKVNMIVFNRPLNNLLSIEIPQNGPVPDKAYFIDDKLEVKIFNAGKNKLNANLYHIQIPKKYKSEKPFTIVLETSFIGDRGEKYQQAKM